MIEKTGDRIPIDTSCSVREHILNPLLGIGDGPRFMLSVDSECRLRYSLSEVFKTGECNMPTLFSYTIPIDDGAAPNPFHGMCSLAICKPKIRQVARPGDWIAGLGSKNAPSGNLEGRLVYAMRVEDTLSLADYDRHASSRWPHRIPNVASANLSDCLGDCIYDFSSGKPVQRPGVHGRKNEKIDLSGGNALISRHFYYFGGRARPLPENLRPICHQTQGHRGDSNAVYFQDFVEWLEGLKLEVGQIYGWPDFIVDWRQLAASEGCTPRFEE